jgi:hypothetical protein
VAGILAHDADPYLEVGLRPYRPQHAVSGQHASESTERETCPLVSGPNPSKGPEQFRYRPTQPNRHPQTHIISWPHSRGLTYSIAFSLTLILSLATQLLSFLLFHSSASVLFCLSCPAACCCLPAAVARCLPRVLLPLPRTDHLIAGPRRSPYPLPCSSRITPYSLPLFSVWPRCALPSWPPNSALILDPALP